MPDFERLTDDLMLDLAKTPEQTAYAQGYIAGKTQARKDVAIIAMFLMFLLCVVSFVTT